MVHLEIRKASGSVATWRLLVGSVAMGEVTIKEDRIPAITWLYIYPPNRSGGFGRECVQAIKAKYGRAPATEHELDSARGFWEKMRQEGLVA